MTRPACSGNVNVLVKLGKNDVVIRPADTTGCLRVLSAVVLADFNNEIACFNVIVFLHLRRTFLFSQITISLNSNVLIWLCLNFKPGQQILFNFFLDFFHMMGTLGLVSPHSK